MPRLKDYTPVIQRYLAGERIPNLAREYDISREALWQGLKDRGVIIRKTTRSKNINGLRPCKTCEQLKPLSDFYFSPKNKSFDPHCKPCKIRRERPHARPWGHTESPDYPQVALKRLMAKVTIAASGCWEYTGTPKRKRYGSIGYANRSMLPHRLSWLLHKSEIPPGLNVLHECDNTRCVNPAHLFLGTQQDNVDDCISKGRFKIGRRQ